MTKNCNRRLILPLQLCGTACAGPSVVMSKKTKLYEAGFGLDVVQDILKAFTYAVFGTCRI